MKMGSLANPRLIGLLFLTLVGLGRVTAEVTSPTAKTAVTTYEFIAPPQSVEVVFQQALTPTVGTTAPDYSGYDVVSVQEIDLFAGPARTGAHLSPDGLRFAHFEGPQVCVYSLNANDVYTESSCFVLETEGEPLRIGVPEDVAWSPDGRYLTLPIYQLALQLFVDTDVLVLDTETGAVLNLTDDHVDDDLMDPEQAFALDLAPVWLDADTLAFLRYASEPGESGVLPVAPPAVYTVDLTNGEAEQLVDLNTTDRLPAYMLAIAPDGEHAAYNIDIPDNDNANGIWQISLTGNGQRQLLHVDRQRGLPSVFDYSADGRYLFTTLFQPGTGESNVLVVERETGNVTELAPGRRVLGAGWSPEGAALVYIVIDEDNPDESGLYLAPEPSEPGQLLLQGDFYPTTCCQRSSIDWGANNVVMIGRGAESSLLLVELGAKQ